MNWIHEALNSLIEGIQTIFEFIGSVFSGIIEVGSYIPLMFDVITQGIGQMPTFLVAFATITATILSLFLILGRDNGS